MKLDDFAGVLPLSGLGSGTIEPGTIEVSGIVSDSRQVEPGFLFAALPGSSSDGAIFAAEAEKRGASAIIASRTAVLQPLSIPVLRVEEPRRALALAAARLHGAQPEVMVAVTGTAGKTSVASFARQIWEFCGISAASIGTTGVVSPGRVEYGALTTPDPVALHLLLKELAQADVSHAAMEASSHGLDQCRLDGVVLKAGAFTNLGRDHLDYHPTLEAYLKAKLRLFDTLLPAGAPAIIFADDAWSKAVEEAAAARALNVLTVGRGGAFMQLKRVEHERFRQRAELEIDGRLHEVELPLAGDFQLYNALVACALAVATGTGLDSALAALGRLKGAPGRLDLVGTSADGAPVYVDYAHKPDALEKVLLAVRPFTTGRVIVVFGCGGDRDRGKRPLMGSIAHRLADLVIVTDDNPRSEAASAIRSAIMAAVPDGVEIADRREAIRCAVAMLRTGDTLIIAGKGHEIGQTIGTETIPFSDHEEARTALGDLHP